MSEKLTLRQEETLSEEVKLYPCLFDKADKGYKERDCVENAWQEVAQKLSFLETGKNQILFFSFI